LLLLLLQRLLLLLLLMLLLLMLLVQAGNQTGDPCGGREQAAVAAVVSQGSKQGTFVEAPFLFHLLSSCQTIYYTSPVRSPHLAHPSTEPSSTFAHHITLHYTSLRLVAFRRTQVCQKTCFRFGTTSTCPGFSATQNSGLAVWFCVAEFACCRSLG
jgi:hypothetical protein